MTRDLVIGFLGKDQPGIVRHLSQVVSKHGGNWLQSQMVQLGGFFSGMAQVECAQEDIEAMTQALQSIPDLTVNVLDPVQSDASADGARMHLNIVGPDRRGILSEVMNELAAREVNVLQLETSVAPAPMSGELLFTADAEVQVPVKTDLAELVEQLNMIGDNLGVDVLLEED